MKSLLFWLKTHDRETVLFLGIVIGWCLSVISYFLAWCWSDRRRKNEMKYGSRRKGG